MFQCGLGSFFFFYLQQLLGIGGKIMSLWTSFCQFNASYVRIKETLPCLLGTKK
mgnify:FL=1